MQRPNNGARRMHPSAHWEIVGYDSMTQLFRTEIPVGRITVANVQHLLRALTAKHALNSTETTASFLKRGVTGRQPHLDIQTSNDLITRTTTYSCGSNPYFIAKVVLQAE